MKTVFNKVLEATLVVAALATAGLAWKRSSEPAGPKPIVVKDWRAQLALDRRIGPKTAPFQLAVWTDYQCPACRQLEGELRTLRARLRDSLAIVYHYFPLPSHSLAFNAAMLAECAQRKDSFASMHEALFAMNIRGDTIAIDSLAHLNVGVPAAELRRCAVDPAVRAIVQSDVDRGVAYGLRGTPYLQIDDKLTMGGMPAADLETRLRKSAR